MRRLWILVLLGLMAGLWIWPYLGALAIVQAAETHDAAALAARVNTPALNRSIGRQIVAAYLRRSGRGDRLGAAGRGLASAIGPTIAAPYLDELLAPERLATFLAQGRLGDLRVGDRTVPIARAVPNLSAVLRSHLGDVVLHSAYDGIASFRFSIPAGGPDDYGVHIRLSGLTWRLSGLDLPSAVLDRIADDAIAAERSGTPAGG